MKFRICEFLVNKCISQGIVEQEDAEIYTFGLKSILSYIVGLLISCSIGVLFHMFWQALIIYAFVYPLRIYVGGYHAQKPSTCFIYSVALFSLAMVVLKCFWISINIQVAIIVILQFFLITLCPIASENKRLYHYEITKYKKNAIIVLCIESVIWLLLNYFKYYHIAQAIVVADGIVLTVIILGVIDKIRRNRSEERRVGKEC